MNTSHPVNDKDDLSALRVNVGDHFANEFAHNAFLQADVSTRITPDRLQISCQHRELLRTRWAPSPRSCRDAVQFGSPVQRRARESDSSVAPILPPPDDWRGRW